MKATALIVLLLGLMVHPSTILVRQSGSTPDAKLKLCPTEDAMAIRFFYNSESNYFHGPLLFRSVPAGDPRLNTAPMLDEGRTAYISREEMSDLMSRLASTDFLWRNSEKSEALGKGTRIPYRGDFMQLLVLCRKSTSKGRIEPKQICQKLAPLDTALVSPRARWEFQLFRIGDGCTVQNFDEAAFPDHNYGN